MGVKTARLIIAGLSGDSGKTIVSLSLAVALSRRGHKVATFKKGPDYIDAAWLSAVSGDLCHNLDTWLAHNKTVVDIFTHKAQTAEFALIEGNRGLFDGKDMEGSHSTAELAKLLQAPLILTVDATKATRTIAALIKGCQVFDPEIKIDGVILNKIAGERHRRIITAAVEKYCGLPVLGAIPKLGQDAAIIPGRHLGLIPPAEFIATHNVTDKLLNIAENYIDIDRLIKIAKNAPEMPEAGPSHEVEACQAVRIGYFRDSVFTFYYPENLEALEHHGAQLVPLSSLESSSLPPIDGLYIGGGFPETQAEKLCANRALMNSVRSAADSGMPIYAECGGLIYLCRSLLWDDKKFEMTGVFPIDLEMNAKPAGHGYTELLCDRDNPFFGTGTAIRGHEFHYTRPVDNSDCPKTSLKVKRGSGLGNERDGLLYKNTMAAYTHIHAAGNVEWAHRFIAAAAEFKRGKGSASGLGTPHGCVCSAGY